MSKITESSEIQRCALVKELREELKIAISPQWHPQLSARIDNILSRLTEQDDKTEAG